MRRSEVTFDGETVVKRETTSPSVACVILNWNGWKDTLTCLRALSQSHYNNLSVVVVDNGSTDGSVAQILAAVPNVPLIKTGRNLGFGAGNNAGIEYALRQNPDFIWLLNNDTEPSPTALSELVVKAQADPRLGEVGSVLMYAHDPSKVQAWGGGKVSLWTGTTVHAFEAREDGWFDYLTAASVLLPRAALSDVGVFDESYFLYWEDSDLSFRLRERGWKLGVAEKSIVLHKEHASTGRNRRVIDRYAIASGIRFLSKHAGSPALSISLFVILRIGRRLLTGQIRRIGDVTGGVKDYLFSASKRPGR